MREIKFRGKRIDNGEWVKGYYFKTPLTDEATGSKPGDGWYFLSGRERHCISQNNAVYEVNPATVGQFTNLHDKNGVEIYEGDILKLKCFDEKATYEERKTSPFAEPKYKTQNSVIEYWQSFTNIGYRLRNGKGKTFMVKPSALSNMEAEVIGNIYENPELLESEVNK